MFTDKEINEIINKKISADEKPGDRTGGSGHLGFVSYRINHYKTRQMSHERVEIIFNYTVYVETEFTSYPDNPPMEYTYERKIIVNCDKEIVG